MRILRIQLESWKKIIGKISSCENHMLQLEVTFIRHYIKTYVLSPLGNIGSTLRYVMCLFWSKQHSTVWLQFYSGLFPVLTQVWFFSPGWLSRSDSLSDEYLSWYTVNNWVYCMCKSSLYAAVSFFKNFNSIGVLVKKN